MNTLFRILLILAMALGVVGATYGAAQTGALNTLTAGQASRGGGQTVSNGTPSGAPTGRHDDAGGGLMGLTTLLKNVLIVAGLTSAVITVSKLGEVTRQRWQRRPA